MISQIFVFAMRGLSGYVAYGLYRKRIMWRWIVAYWLVLTAKTYPIYSGKEEAELGKSKEALRERIMPNDIVRHVASGETWAVAAVNHERGYLIPGGWPFPSYALIDGCELIERRYETEPQSEKMIRELIAHGCAAYVDRRSAQLYGISL